MPLRRTILFGSALLLASGILVTWLVPWRTVSETKLQAMLQQATGQKVVFSISEVGLRESRLNDLRLGGTESPVLLSEIKVAYALPELWHGHLGHLKLAGLSLTAHETDRGWQLAGWQPAPTTADKTANAISWLVPPPLPLQSIELTDSKIDLQALLWQLNLPVSIAWQQQPTILSLESLAPQLVSGSHSAIVKRMLARAVFDPERTAWQGSWSLYDLGIAINGLPPPPPLQAKGSITLDQQKLAISGAAHDATKAWALQFNLTRDHTGIRPALLQVPKAAMPFLGGAIRLRDLHWPLDGQSALRTNVIAEKLPLETLLQHFTSEEVHGSGTVSGEIPLTRQADGKLLIPESVLQTDSAGTIAIPANYFPGDNPQLAVLREILTDLHYESLSLTVSSDANGKLQLKVSLAGHNPTVQNGKPVKLNVNLGGDVLGLIDNQLLSIIAPTQLLRKNHDQK